MKLYSILLGWIGILTKSCVSSQVFYGSIKHGLAGDALGKALIDLLPKPGTTIPSNLSRYVGMNLSGRVAVTAEILTIVGGLAAAPPPDLTRNNMGDRLLAPPHDALGTRALRPAWVLMSLTVR